MIDSSIPSDLFPTIEIRDNSGQIDALFREVIDNPDKLTPIIEIVDKSEPLRLFITDMFNAIIILQRKVTKLESQ